MMSTLLSMMYAGLACLIFLVICGWTIYILGDIHNEEENGRK